MYISYVSTARHIVSECVCNVFSVTFSRAFTNCSFPSVADLSCKFCFYFLFNFESITLWLRYATHTSLVHSRNALFFQLVALWITQLARVQKICQFLKSWCYCVYSCDDYSESRASLASELHGQFPFHRKDKLPLMRLILLHSRDFRRRTHSWRSQSGRSKHPVTCFLSTTANRWRGTIESRAGCPEKHTVRSENAVVWHETGDLSLDCSN